MVNIDSINLARSALLGMISPAPADRFSHLVIAVTAGEQMIALLRNGGGPISDNLREAIEQLRIEANQLLQAATLELARNLGALRAVPLFPTVEAIEERGIEAANIEARDSRTVEQKLAAYSDPARCLCGLCSLARLRRTPAPHTIPMLVSSFKPEGEAG